MKWGVIMTINKGVKFVYANRTIDEFAMGLASAIGSISRSGNVEDRNIITTQNVFSNRFNLHGIKYDKPLTFDLILYKEDSSFINANEERTLKKWLLCNRYDWLYVYDQADLSSVYYYCIASSAEMIDVGVYSGGLKITFICDAPWAYSELIKRNYTCTSTLSLKLNTPIDFNQMIVYPSIVITALSNGNITINNNTTGDSVVFNNCTNGEVIKVDFDADKISSTKDNIISRWNKKSFGFCDGLNDITLNGNFKITIEYRLPIRVGA